MTVMPVVVGVLETVSKYLEKRLEDLETGKRIKAIQTTVFLRLARILKRVLENRGDLLSLRIQ